MTVVSVVLAGVCMVSSQAVAGADRDGAGQRHHGHHHGGKHKNRADLDMVAMDAVFSGGEVKLSFLVRNKGRRPAPANQAQISISIDNTADAIDTIVGRVPVPLLDPHESQQVNAVLPVPVAMTPSYYHVISCADAQHTVKERSRYNNCRGTKDYMLSPAVVRVDATKGGAVATSNVSGGGCNGTLCGFLPGAGTVTFTPTPDSLYRFAGWSGCTGYATGAGSSITFSKVGTSHACKATFAPLLKVSWATSGSGNVEASIAPPTCSAAGASGSCLLADGSTPLSLAATPNALWGFSSWSDGTGGPCAGVVSGPGGSTVTFSNLTAAASCVATFTFLGL